jgi:Ca2+-binding RTX toxin-like protein
MAIELSNLTFTDEDDIVPASGVERILNTAIANTLAGNDIITGTGGKYSIFNSGTLNTAEGNDIITGIHNHPGEDTIFGYGI